jgi:hypothetical protein
MTPAADLELAGEARIAFLSMPKELGFAQQQGWIINAEIEAVAIAQLRIIGSRTCCVTVEDGSDQGQVLRNVCAKPGPHGSQRGRRAATWHVERKAGRPTE